MIELDYRAIGKRIRARRIEMGYTQEKIAEMTDISTSHFGEIERGTSVCSLAVIVSIAECLELNLDSLIKGIEYENIETGFSEILEKIPDSNKKLYIKLCENIAETLK